MSTESRSSRTLVLVKHAQPVMDASLPPRDWRLGSEGEAQSRTLAARLKRFLPFGLVSSNEPKAMRTAEIVAADLGVACRAIDGLEEYDRPAMPIVSRAEHERLNAPLFETRSVPLLGRESANAALARFRAAITSALDSSPPAQNLVVVAHGTVIALFVEHETGRNAFDVWKHLECADYLTL